MPIPSKGGVAPGAEISVEVLPAPVPGGLPVESPFNFKLFTHEALILPSNLKLCLKI